MEFTEKADGIVFRVCVLPKTSKGEIAGESGGALKIKLKSLPARGAANAELVKLLSKTFGVTKSEIEIISGEISRNKKLKISNLSAEDFLKSLAKFNSFPQTIYKK